MEKSKSKSGQVLSFLDALETAKNQVEFYAFEKDDAELAEILCRIIATIYQLPKNKVVSIGGEKKTAEEVAAVYSLIKHENLEHIITTFCQIKYRVKHINTYLRTALYNSVFESAAFWENLVQSTRGGS